MLVDIVVFLLVLGVLVFFHELGHFLAAKACGIYVDRFSLGMPPRVFGVRLGETDYCIGALPFGGYVKMAGQEDTPLSDEEREETYGKVPPERWFNRKPIWQRFIVIFAGPAMNFVLAILLYAIVAAVGAQVPETDVDNRIGMVEPNSPAAQAPMYLVKEGGQADLSGAPDARGWQPGDRIVEINGNRVRSIIDVALDAALGAGDTLSVVVDRPQPDGTYARYVSPVQPTPIKESDRHARFGVGPFETALIEGVQADSPALAAGLKPGDVITRVNGQIVGRQAFVEMVEDTPEGQALTLEIERDGQKVTQTVQPKKVGRFQGVLLGPAGGTSDPAESVPVVLSVTEEYKEQGKLRPGDRVEQVNGQPATVALLREIEQSQPGTQLNLQVKRPAVMLGLLRDAEQFDAMLEVSPVGAVGVQLGQKMVFKRTPLGEVIPEAFHLSYRALARTVKTLVMLFAGTVSPKDLGGPVMIYQVTTNAARAGFWWLFDITAFISVNLCVFNLLPLPVLDGGLLVYLVVEGVRGKPLSAKVQERIQQVGLVLILGLLLFVTFNDISRIVTNALG